MARNSVLRNRIADIVREVIQEQQQNTVNKDPESGTVSVVNKDGTVDVVTAGGNTYTAIGAAVAMTIGTQIIVITADGTKVAIPK
jgi:hypothetical protein